MQIGMPYIPRPSFPGSIGYSSYNNGFWRPRDGEREPGSSNSSTDRGEIRDAQQQQLRLFPSLRFSSSSSNSSSLLHCKQKGVKDASCAFSSARGGTATELHQNHFSSTLAYFHPITLPPLFVWPDFIHPQVYFYMRIFER